MAAPDYSGVTSDIQAGYNAQRQKAAQQEAGNLQGQRDALERRAAALGGGPSGAFVKAEQQAGNASAQRLGQANEDINAAQNAELRGVKMTQLGQQYGTSEREAGQTFQAGQQATQIGAQKEMQQTGLAAAASQQDKEITAQKAMQQTGITAQSSLQDRQIASQQLMQTLGINAQSSLQDKQLAAQAAMQATGISAQEAMQKAGFSQAEIMQQEQQSYAESENQKVRDLQGAQFEKEFGFKKEEFEEQKGVDAFNEKMAEEMANKKDMLEKFFGQFTLGNIGQGIGGSGAAQGASGGLKSIGDTISGWMGV